MRIVVYDIAAEIGGALSILNLFYQKALEDKDNEWIFLVYKKEFLPNNDRVKVYDYSFPKKSWFHRLYFDKFKITKIIKEFNPDLIYNLQNVYVKVKGVKQTLYLHQPLPFTDLKISIFDFIPWLYKHVIGRMIFKSVKNVDHVIVQTEWLKQALLDRKLCTEDKITVRNVEVKLDKDIKYAPQKETVFFYPANSEKYKNHITLLKACKLLKDEGVDCHLVFSLTGEESKNAKKLCEFTKAHNLNVEWLGRLDKDQVYDYYSKSVLVFPSRLETFGLPLKEASLVQSPIIASDTPFAREILKDYKDVKFFAATDHVALAKLLKEKI